MWVFTETGFVSVVSQFNKDETLCIRARDYESIDPIAKQINRVISHTPESDYPYRLENVEKSDFILFLMQSVDLLSYKNFKNQVHATRGSDFAQALTKVWSTMQDVEDYEARRYIR